MEMIEDRKEHNRQQIIGLARWIAAAMVAPALVLALLVLAATKNPLLTLLALIVGYAGVAGFVYQTGRGFGVAMLGRLDLEPADEVTRARLHNLTEGLCVAHGLTKPDLHVVRSPQFNAATVVVRERDPRQVALLLSEGLLDSLSRIELEGVLAQQLSHVRDGDTALATLVAALASLPVIGGVVAARAGSCLDPHGEQLADLAGVGLTRYPPGLADALEHISAHDTAIDGVTPRAAHLWMADPLPAPVTDGGADGSSSGDGRSAEPFVPHPPLSDRVLVLREL